MSSRQQQFESVAQLFEYPRAEYCEHLRCGIDAVGGSAPALAEFAAQTQGHSISEIEELYTATFDLNPACTLEIGWHLFGEDYASGLFLVKMRHELRAHEIKEGLNLTDHLTSVLRLLGRMSNEHAEEFASACVYPALVKMTLPPENLFHRLLAAARQLISSHFPEAASAQPRASLPVIAEGVLS